MLLQSMPLSVPVRAYSTHIDTGRASRYPEYVNEPDPPEIDVPGEELSPVPLHENPLLARWESLSAGQQFRRGWVAAIVVLGLIHIPFILTENITILMAIGYAVFEGFMVAGLVTLATQGEIARRRAGRD